MNTTHYHLIITGVSLAAGLIATTLARVGLNILWLAPENQSKHYPEHIVPCFYHPFKEWGVSQPQWPFDWILAPINGIVVNQELFQGQGVILDQDKALASMLSDAHHLGVEIAIEWADLTWNLAEKKLRWPTGEAVFDLVLRTTPLPDESMMIPGISESKGVVVRALVPKTEVSPGYAEIHTSDNGQLLLLPAGKRLNALFYRQTTAEQIDANFQRMLQQRFPQSRFRFPPLRPRHVSARPPERVYQDGVIQLSTGLGFGPWDLAAELNVGWAQTVLRQLPLFFADKQEKHLMLLNDHAVKWQARQHPAAHTHTFFYDVIG